jgi:hypothetical protein
MRIHWTIVIVRARFGVPTPKNASFGVSLMISRSYMILLVFSLQYRVFASAPTPRIRSIMMRSPSVYNRYID